MRITISGAQSTGKSTLLEALKARPELKDFTFLGGITRQTQAAGIQINEGGSNFSQLMVMAKHLQHFVSENSVLDRCAIDGVVYTHYLFNRKKVTKNVLRIAEEIAQQLKYDLYFYLAPEFDIVDDGVRSIDKQFQTDIAELFEDYYALYRINPIRLTGSVEQRVNTFMEVYNKYAEHLNGREEEMKNIKQELNSLVKEQIAKLQKGI